MEKLLFEIGRVFNSFIINIIKSEKNDPIYIFIDFEGNFFKEEIKKIALEEAIIHGLQKFETMQAQVMQSAFIIPADLVENGLRKEGIAAFIYDSLYEKKLIITLSFEKKEKFVIDSYQVEEAININEEELKKLEEYFLKGLLQENRLFWIEQVKMKVKAK